MANRKRGSKKLTLTEQLEYFWLNVEGKGAWLHCTHDECKGVFTSTNIKFFENAIDLNNLINTVLHHFEEYHKEHKELRKLTGRDVVSQ